MKKLFVDVTPLRDFPVYRRIWLGYALSGIGTQMTTFAVAFQVWTMTHSSVAVGGVGLAGAVPTVAFGLIGGSPRTLGLMTSAVAIGGIVGSALSRPVGRVRRPGRAMLGAIVVWGAALALFGLATSLWVALATLLAAGVADVVSVVFRTSVVQLATPDSLRGRVSAAEYVVGAGCPQLGNFRGGLVAQLTSPATSAISGGLSVIAGVALIRPFLPALARHTIPSATAAAVAEQVPVDVA